MTESTTLTPGREYERVCRCGGECLLARCGHRYRLLRFALDAMVPTALCAIVEGLTGPDAGRWLVYGPAQFARAFAEVLGGRDDA